MNIKTASFIVIAFIGVIFFAISYLKLLNKLLEQNKEDSNWDANKAREESKIGLKREVNEEIKLIQNSIRCATGRGEYYTSYLKPKEETIEYFKNKGYNIELIIGEVFKGVIINHYKISWEENK